MSASLPARLAARTCAAGAAGALLAAAFPGGAPGPAWALTPISLAVMAWSVRDVRARRGAWLGLVSGLLFFGLHVHWTGVYVGALPWIALTVLEASFFAVPGALVAASWSRGPRTLAAGLVFGWVLEEALRSRLPFGGFPWGRLAFSQADSPLLGWAWLGGAPLVAAACAAIAAVLVLVTTSLAAASQTPDQRRRRGPVRPAAAAALALAALLAGGLCCSALARSTAQANGDVAVAAVQGDVPEPGLDFNAERRAVLDNHVAGTLALAHRVATGASRRPDLVLWPENSSDIDPLTNVDAAEQITRAADAIGRPVVVGAVVDGPGRYISNTSIVWGPSDTPEAGPGVRYVKRHPAPFAEYIPARSFFRRFSSKVDLVTRDFAAGGDVGALAVHTNGRTLRLGDVICFEVAYDGLVQDPVRDGADLVVVQTNNATFGFTDESVQQLAMSRVRAVETGRSVVHVSTVGVSALIRPDGSEVTRSGLFVPAVLEGTLPLRTDITPAVALGAWIEALLLAGAALAALPRRRRRAQGDPSATVEMTPPPLVHGSLT